MIFVTVGTQKPFPRLARMMADWARAHPDTHVTLQHGSDTEVQGAANVKVHQHLSADAFMQMVGEAEVIVAHAGIGTLLAARAAQVPVVVVPRAASAGEHRNDHQLDTARALVDLESVFVAHDAEQLERAIDRARGSGGMSDLAEPPELTRLARYVGDFIRDGGVGALPADADSNY